MSEHGPVLVVLMVWRELWSDLKNPTPTVGYMCALAEELGFDPELLTREGLLAVVAAYEYGGTPLRQTTRGTVVPAFPQERAWIDIADRADRILNAERIERHAGRRRRRRPGV